MKEARKNLVVVSLTGRTIPHAVTARFGAARVVMLPAPPGTGVIAGATMRAVIVAAGIQDVLTKCLGSANPVNLVKATMQGLLMLRTKDQVEALRGVEISG